MDALDEKIKALSLKDDTGRLLNEINGKLTNVENTKKWFDKYGPFSTATLESVLKICAAETEECASQLDLEYAAIENIAKKCIEAKIQIENGEMQEALTIIEETKKLVNELKKQKYFVDDYAVGLEFVVHCLEIEVDTKLKDISVEKLEQHLKDLKRYETFDVLHKVAILALEQYFVGNIRRDTASHDIQIEIIKTMIKMDPKNLEWRYCLYTLYFFKRQNSSSSFVPTNDEKDAIITAYKMSADSFHARIHLGYITCMAETLKSQPRFSTSIPFGDYISFDTALYCIRKDAEKILKIDPNSVRSNINIAKIYTSILPMRHRDSEFAKTCIERALTFRPYSSKANHRMGLLYISSKNFDSAISYLERGLDSDHRNKRVIVDLMKTYLRDVDKYQAELRVVFDKVLKDTDQGEHVKVAEYIYMKAISQFFMKKFDLGVKLLIDAYNMDQNITKEVENVYRDKLRFVWKDNDFFEQRFRKLLIESSRKASSSNDKQILEKFVAAFDKANKPRYHGSSGFKR